MRDGNVGSFGGEELQIVAEISTSNMCSPAARGLHVARGRRDVAFINHVGILMKV